jgi:D-alanine transaminase
MPQVFLNGKFTPEIDAKISPLDRGFLFGDGVYEVIPVYNRQIFGMQQHLERLNSSLEATYIPNPYSYAKYQEILEQLITNNNFKHQKIYLQITRGASNTRNHTPKKLQPTVYIRADELKPKTKNELTQGFKVITATDKRWDNCSIKATSLLANVLYAIEADKQQVEEVILHRDNIITEGASSNVFILKDKIIYTPKLDNCILAGITRDMVIKSAKQAGISIKEQTLTKDELLNADEVWISSSTREVMPIIQIDDIKLKKPSAVWDKIWTNFQQLKNAN